MARLRPVDVQAIPPRGEFAHSVDVQAGQLLSWEVEVTSGFADMALGKSDIWLSVSTLWTADGSAAEPADTYHRKICDRLSNQGLQTLQEGTQVVASQGKMRGKHVTSRPGVVWLRLSNAHSRLRSKTVELKVGLGEATPEQTEGSQAEEGGGTSTRGGALEADSTNGSKKGNSWACCSHR